ncbi:WD40-repeat-containing domain protein [Lipomyces kononenkoae]
MDFRRCKILDFTSHSITALAFSHASVTPDNYAPRTLRLAVGRANGDIEIWNPRSSWVHELTLKGGRNRSIEGLAWIQSGNDLRLFSIGGSTVLTEWDLQSGLPLDHCDCNAGIVWSIAPSPDGTKIAAGCDDGSVVIIDVAGGRGVMLPLRILQRQKSRVLSIAWRGNTQVIGGCADGRIRVWTAVAADETGRPNGVAATKDGVVGRIIGTMRVDKAQGEETLVWSVLTLGNGKTIVSGDSTGSVKFWDATHLSLLQTFKVHEADVLCLASNEAGESVFSAGVDRKIVRYAIVDNKLRRWANMSSRLLHAQDIRALASYESKASNYLISGGVEQSIVINSIDNFIDGVFRKIPVSPQRHSVHSVGGRRLIALHSDNQVKIYTLEKFNTLAEANSEAKNRRLVASLTLNNDENITHAVLSADAKYLAVATNAQTKLFLLLPSQQGTTFKVKKIAAPALAEQGCSVLHFDPSGKHLVLVSPENEIFIHTVGQQDKLRELPYPAKPTEAKSELKQALPYLDNINHLAFSDDGKYFVVSTIVGSVVTYDWPKQSIYWILPRISSTPSVVKFCPDNDSLIIVTTQMKILQFSLSEQALSDWSRRNSGFLPPEFNNLVDKCSGIYIDDDAPERAWMWGASWLANFDMSADIPVFRIPKRKRNGLSVE